MEHRPGAQRRRDEWTGPGDAASRRDADDARRTDPRTRHRSARTLEHRPGPQQPKAILMAWSDADLASLNEIYNLQCTSRMSTHYYEARLGRLQTIAFWMEVTTAATASGSGVLALLDGSDWGKTAWQVLALTAALVAIIKPIYAPGKKIEIFTRQRQGYHTNYFALKKIAFGIRQEGRVSADARRRYDTVFDRHVQLSTEDESTPNQVLLRRAREMTAAELPASAFWFPDPDAVPAPAVPEPTQAEPPQVEAAEAQPPRENTAEVVQLKTS
jgi:hypothetical protein